MACHISRDPANQMFVAQVDICTAPTDRTCC
jgi:hypothetical protein